MNNFDKLKEQLKESKKKKIQEQIDDISLVLEEILE